MILHDLNNKVKGFFIHLILPFHMVQVEYSFNKIQKSYDGLNNKIHKNFGLFTVLFSILKLKAHWYAFKI